MSASGSREPVQRLASPSDQCLSANSEGASATSSEIRAYAVVRHRISLAYADILKCDCHVYIYASACRDYRKSVYTEGFCGRAVIPLSESGASADEVHVPLAHQSALAGILLTAVGVGMGLSRCVGSVVTRYDVLKPQKRFQTYPLARSRVKRCICKMQTIVNCTERNIGDSPTAMRQRSERRTQRWQRKILFLDATGILAQRRR